MQETIANSFEEYMRDKCKCSNITLLQYGNYIAGWRQTMPWAWKGMSIAYDAWAEKQYKKEYSCKKMRVAWDKANVFHLISRANTTEELATDFLHE